MSAEDILLDIGISPELKGFNYIREFLVTDFEDDILNNCYDYIAHKYKTTPSSVERGIRHAIESTYYNIPENYKQQIFRNVCLNKDKPNNKTFLFCLKLYYRRRNSK